MAVGDKKMCIFSSKFSNSAYGIPDQRFVLPGTTPQYSPDRDFKTDHMKMQFSFDIPRKTVFGRSTASIKMLTEKGSIFFDAVSMKVKSVKEKNSKILRYAYDGEKIEIILKKKTSIGEWMEIEFEYYITNPQLGVYFISPDKEFPKRPQQIWTHSESEEARFWYPCHDSPHEKMTTEMILTVDDGFFALSNGSLESVKDDKKKRTKTFHWKMNQPHSSYLVMFAVGRFSEIRDEWSNIPIFYYCEKGREEDTKRAFGKTPKAMEFFSRKIARYPYEKYAQVAVKDFIFGGMEHTTSTTQTDLVLHDERAHIESWHDNLMSHELAHQWFGDLVTCRDWAHAWLNESFATYFEALFTQHDKGEDEFLYELLDNARFYFAEDRDKYRRPIVTNLYTEPGDLFDRHLYQKGSLILHMLRHELGDALWWKSIRHYVDKNRNMTVTTENLIEAIEEACGKNMQKFFDQWIYSAGHPELKASYYFDKKSGEAVIRVVQAQKADDQTPIYTLPLCIKIITKKGEKTFFEQLSEKQKQFRYKTEEPQDIRIDPENIILKTLAFSKPKEMWMFQLENDTNLLGKILAISELSKIGSSDCIEALQKSYKKETFWGLHCEIANALVIIRTSDAFNVLKQMADTPDPRARKCVAIALGEFKCEEAAKILKSMFFDKNSYYVPAFSAKSLGKCSPRDSMQFLKKNLSIESWNDVIRCGVLSGMSETRSDDAIKILIEHTARKNSNQARITSIRNLGICGRGREDALNAILDCTKDANSLVQISAASALGELGDERAVPQLENMTKGRRDGRVKRCANESIRKICTWLESDLETDELKERYEKLKADYEMKKSRTANKQ
jgi:aminopeptidase N